VLANSTRVAAELSDVYDIEATVVHPCSTLDLHGRAEPIPGIEPGFVLTPARPLGYKRLDVLVDAARALPDRRFLHVGGGPHSAALAESVPKNLTSLGVGLRQRSGGRADLCRRLWAGPARGRGPWSSHCGSPRSRDTRPSHGHADNLRVHVGPGPGRRHLFRP